MNLSTPIAIIIGSGLIAASLFLAAPRYEIYPIGNSNNPAAWKINKLTGDVSLCATATSADTQAGCSVKLKQY